MLDLPDSGSGKSIRHYLTREPATLALLSAAAVICFLAVSGLSSISHAQQRSIASQWFDRGAADLKRQQFGRAAEEFRTALLYSRDNYSYQLKLAEALIGQERIDEASAYLINLWDREPENGFVNLEIARIAARQGQPERAVRFFHNAIYATWPGDRQDVSRQTRLELIDYLLKIGDEVQARSELIALAENSGDDPSRQAQLGDLFSEAHDYSDALSAYQLSLKSSRHNLAALKGAGRAAFQLGRYRQAEKYLEAAVAAGAQDAETVAGLQTAELVLRMDPFRARLASAERDRIVIQAFAAAGARLQSCAEAADAAGPLPTQQNLWETWQKMKPQITLRGLRQNPDLAQAAMELAFRIERQAGSACRIPDPTDRALILIARLHDGI
jgi:tetratricopeptide (TPR) repeat protein